MALNGQYSLIVISMGKPGRLLPFKIYSLEALMSWSTAE